MTRQYSADGKHYSDDGYIWFPMTAEEIRHREVIARLDAIRFAVEQGAPRQANQAAEEFLRDLLKKHDRR
jgi:hypothetical protein